MEWKEISWQEGNEDWQQIYLQDDATQHDVSDFDTVKDSAGGLAVTLHQTPILIQWRVLDGVLEVMVQLQDSHSTTKKFRLSCRQSKVIGRPAFQPCNDELLLQCTSLFAVHSVRVNLKSDAVVKYKQSYALETISALVQSCCCMLMDRPIYCVVKADGTASVVTLNNGVVMETQLKQNSLMTKLWKGVIASAIRGGNDGERAIDCICVESTASLYILSKLTISRWSLKTLEFVAEWNVASLMHSSGYWALKMRVAIVSDDTILSMLLSNDSQQCLLGIRLSQSGDPKGQLYEVACADHEVIDHNIIGDQLFVLWKDNVGSTAIIILRLGDSYETGAIMESSQLRMVQVSCDEDPREAFSSYIFEPNRFTQSAVRKAVAIFGETGTDSWPDLKMRVCQAVSAEVTRTVYKEEITNEEYRAIQEQVWQKFYSNLLQYQEAANEPLGLVGGGNHYPISIIRTGCVSYLRPCEELENWGTPATDAVVMLHTLNLLRSNLSGFEDHIHESLLLGQPLADTISSIVTSLIDSPDFETVRTKLVTHLQNTHQLLGDLAALQQAININVAIDDVLNGDVDVESNPCYQLSEWERSMLCRSVYELAESRFSLACGLLVLIACLSHIDENLGSRLKTETDELNGAVALLVNAYSVIMWLCRIRSVADSNAEHNLALMEALNLNAIESLGHSPGSNHSHSSPLANFLCGTGGFKVKALLATSGDGYYSRFSALLLATCQTLWPNTADPLLPQHLLSTRQYDHLHTYCALLEDWCKLSNRTRANLQGRVFTLQSEPVKAYHCFEVALYAMFEENNPDQDAQLKQDQLAFCYQVINLFEELGYSEQVIQMAHQTIRVTNGEQPALCTKIFKHSLELERYDEAYKSILFNPDYSRKQDCLRQFVTALCERRLLTTLVSFPYKDITHDLRPGVINIIKSKARSADLTANNYYDLLHSFLIINNDMHGAAAAVYECAQRLNTEVTGLSSLQKQAKCYLACINALRCVPSQSAWLAVPALYCDYKQMSQSSKRMPCGEGKRSHGEVKVFTLSEIENQYMVINMLLKHAKLNPTNQVLGNVNSDPGHVATLLCHTGLYDEAIELCTAFSIDFTSMFDSITYRCIRLMKQSTERRITDDHDDLVRWLGYNQPVVQQAYSSPTDAAWKLLRSYLVKLEVGSTYHRVIVNKLLANSVMPPQWLTTSYKSKNAGELLRLYMQHDMVEEAVELSKEYLTAFTGTGHETFGLKEEITSAMKPASMWLPFTPIDQLLFVLDQHQKDPYYHKLYSKLTTTVNDYLEQIEDHCATLCEQNGQMGLA